MRRLCLALPETTEAVAWGHPVFKAGAKTFAAIEPIDGRMSLAFRLDPASVDLLLSRPSFFETPYGRGLWASTWADSRLDWALMQRLVERSYRTVALKRMLITLDGGDAPAPSTRPRPNQRPRPAR
jgi:predicted DNA-binding protein (MmcQ/YjbR family)